MKRILKEIKFKSQSGISVIELLLYMTLLSVLLTILTSVFVQALDIQKESSVTSSMEQDGNYILTRFVYDVRRAQSIIIPESNGTSSNNFQLTIDEDNYTYSLDVNNNLIISNGLVSANLNGYGTSVSNFSVLRLGNTGGKENSLKINFTLTGRTKKSSGIEVKDFETSVSLRRK